MTADCPPFSFLSSTPDHSERWPSKSALDACRCISSTMLDLKCLPMKHIANWALNSAALRGASFADVRVIAQRSRSLTTKNGKVGSGSDAESVGMNVGAIGDGAWGFG